MNHLMVDIETLSTRPNALILSIGAVVFDPDIPAVFTELTLDVATEATCLTSDTFHIDPKTVMWWLDQPQEARDRITKHPQTFTLFQALQALTAFYRTNKCVGIWGNGAGFDPVILEHAYRAVGLREPWTHRQVRCYRTLAALHPEITPADDAALVKHDALSDALRQAKHAVSIFQSTQQRSAA